ncbi:disease resistance protein RGA2-like [Chenopodium quinoa]|uniref:disease resistance protein RGA2-like n=1 Tax=Chenopodium quinoa TaxID=63459 RepID=UPI000B785DEB|nr:disease resistance protein RGA2-like [Chenopodium quinoa]
MIGRICCLPTQTRSIQRADSSHVLTNFVVGRDRDRDHIVSMMSEDSEAVASKTLSISSIVGISGIGKTALAWYVYNDERMKRYFDVQFWVSATRDFDVKKMLEKIIACGAGELPPNLCDNQLYHHFRQAIGGKKFLLVVDDIWDHDSLRQKWIDLRDLLSAHAAGGSQVLITTHNHKVAEIMSTVNPYMLGNLTENDSWLLFQKIAFTQWQEPGVEAIGKEIAKMCPKMPLVTQSIGGLLAGKRTIQEWHAFRDEQLANNFASYGRDVLHKLKLSFDQLDATQKLCVTYCALFQKGGSFLKDEMIHRWIALDYIKPKYENQSLEEAGEEYMINLHNCGFLQLSDFNDTIFTMQDLMYELVLRLAGFKHKVVDSNTDDIDERVRHLSFWKAATGYKKEYWELPSSVSKIKRLKSLVRDWQILIS